MADVAPLTLLLFAFIVVRTNNFPLAVKILSQRRIQISLYNLRLQRKSIWTFVNIEHSFACSVLADVPRRPWWLILNMLHSWHFWNIRNFSNCPFSFAFLFGRWSLSLLNRLNFLFMHCRSFNRLNVFLQHKRWWNQIASQVLSTCTSLGRLCLMLLHTC